MPIYEYECEKCGHVFEAIQKVAARPLRQCERETCKGKVERLVSSPAIQFKGTGWYVTDYARKDKGGDESKAGDKDSSEKSDSKASKASQESQTSKTSKKESTAGSSKSDKKTKSS